MQLHSIGLLSAAEYQQYKESISPLARNWWLRDTDEFYQEYVHWNGEVHLSMPTEEMFVRPCVRVSDYLAKPGDKIVIFSYSWTVLDVNEEEDIAFALCDTAITWRAANNCCGTPFENTTLAQWLNTWVARRLQIRSDAEYKRRRKINECGMKISSNGFLMKWLFPTLLLFTLMAGVLISLGSYMYIELPALFTILTNLTLVLVSVVVFLYTIFVIYSPHKDTSIRCLLNVAMTVAVLILFADSLSIAACLVRLATLLSSCINFSYLRSIKYYS